MNQIKPSPILMILGLFLFIYILFPTANSSMDGIGYAADAKWGIGLFSPHHLFYTAFIWLVGNGLQLFFSFNIDFLILGKAINGLFAVGSLWALFICLSQINADSRWPTVMVFVVGSCFGIMRFATENETYILPIFWSLLGTYYFLKWDKDLKSTDAALAGLFLASACLLHQIHVLWWIGIAVAIFVKRRISILLFVFPALIVPVAYVWVAFVYYQYPMTLDGVLGFVFSSFHTGTATLSISGLGMARFMVSLIRTFIQVHGTTWLLMTAGVYASLYKLFAGMLVATTGFLLIRNKIWKYLAFPTFNYLSLTFLGIIILHLLFALTSFGNSEFMVMVPFLFALFGVSSSFFKFEFFSYIVPFLFTWNTMFGIIPSQVFVFTAFQYWANRAIENPKAVFLMRQTGEVSGTLYYKTGIYRNNVRESDVRSERFEAKVDSLLDNNIKVYTDCVSSSPFLNTDAILMKNKQENFYKKFKVVKVDSARVYGGWEYLYELKGRVKG